MRPMLIYVSGPYSAPTLGGRLDNAETAIHVGRAILDLGHYPVVPHLTHWFDEAIALTPAGRLDYDTYIAWDLEILRRCDALFFIAASRGADIERAEAERLGLPIYTNLGAIPTIKEAPAWSG